MSELVMTNDLGGSAEVAATLGCPKQQIAKLRQRRDFPEPLVLLAATPIWDLRDIRHFRDTWKRRHKALDRITM